MRNDFESNYLEHSAKGTSWKAGVSYIKKVPLGNGKFYYIYTQEQLNAWNKRHSSGANNVLSNKEVESRKQQAFSSPSSIDGLVKSGMKAAGNTKEEKEANLKKNISDGEKLIADKLATDSTKSSSKKSSGGSSKKSSGSKSKGGSGSSKTSSKKEKSGAAKEKSSKDKAEKASKEKKTVKTKVKESDNNITTMDDLLKSNGKSSSDVSTFKGSASEFKKNLLSKYKDGSFGYLSAGNKYYTFKIKNGDVILTDYSSGKEVSFDKYLKDIRSFKEFAINKKKT